MAVDDTEDIICTTKVNRFLELNVEQLWRFTLDSERR